MLQYWHVFISGGSYTIYFICLVIDFIGERERGVVPLLVGLLWV